MYLINLVMVHQPLYTIYLESARYALKTHDWAVISKCLCGIIEKCRTTLYWRQGAQNIVWIVCQIQYSIILNLQIINGLTEFLFNFFTAWITHSDKPL